MNKDKKTADAFANSWNHLPQGSVYTKEQFKDWIFPIEQKDVKGKEVLELGCGNGSLMLHIISWEPSLLVGVDLGDSVKSANINLSMSNFKHWIITKDDLTTYQSHGFDVVYCIGVLHHLINPKAGLDSVIRNTRKGGRFHCWVYAKEGNWIIIHIVDPIRKLASKLPWWFSKYFIAAQLSLLYYSYAKFIKLFKKVSFVKKMPLYEYSLWISAREFEFFLHVAFDQLVTPQTTYIDKRKIIQWLNDYQEIDKSSSYIIMRNGNSWKFGGSIK